MLKIILNEFDINGYVIIGDGDGLVYLKHRDYDDFWIVCEREFDLDMQSELYEKYLATYVNQYPTIKKNTSFLILGAEGAKPHEQIVEIENDPYLFKKYYLPYSQAALAGLIDLLTTQDGGMMPVESLMVNPDVFTQLKGETTEGAYHLLYSVAHKLPILPVIVDHEEITGIDLQLETEQQSCLDWCMGLSDVDEERKMAIEQFSREEA